MTVDKFKTQFDGCTLCGGKHMDGLNCGAAGEAMFLYRATQGRVDVSSCHVRDLMNDCDGGTNFAQAKAVSEHYGVSVGALWQPGRLSALKTLLLTNRYPVQVSIGYRPLMGTANDCFGGQFPGAHRIYVKGAGSTGIRYGDPGANGRRADVPLSWQTMSWTMFGRVTGALPLSDGGPTLEQDYGTGYVYAYIGPADPVPATSLWNVTIRVPTGVPAVQLYTRPFVKVTPTPTDSGRVRNAGYRCERTKVNGYWWFRILDAGTNHGRFFTPSRYTTAVAA